MDDPLRTMANDLQLSMEKNRYTRDQVIECTNAIQDPFLTRAMQRLLTAQEELSDYDPYICNNEYGRKCQKNYDEAKSVYLSELAGVIRKISATKCFISYKWQDDEHNKWVERLAGQLRKHGIDAQLDKWELRAGDSLTEYMASKIDQASVVLCVITDEFVQSVEAPPGKGGATKFEMQLAVSRRTAGDSVRIIGIYKQGAKQPHYLRDHVYIDFRNESLYQQQLKTLIDDIRGVSRKPPIEFSTSR